MKQLILLLLTGFVLASCQDAVTLTDEEQQLVRAEVRQMLTTYDEEVRKNGLPAEFKYLDNSPDFFWVPPGYTSPISYDSIASIIKGNASRYSLVDNRWDTLAIYPLTRELATFSGRISSTLAPVDGIVISTSLMETGTVIKRKDGWKLLNGHTTLLESNDIY